MTRRSLVCAGSAALALPTMVRAQPLKISPDDWAGVSASVIENAAQFVIPAFQPAGRPGHYSAAYAALSAMFGQWEECGLAGRLNGQIADYLAQAATFDFRNAAERVRAAYGWVLPDGWWLPGVNTVQSAMQMLPTWPQMYRSMLEVTARRGEFIRRRLEDITVCIPVWGGCPTIADSWTTIGGVLLILSGAIALAFGTALIAGIGIGVIAIGIAFVALGGHS